MENPTTTNAAPTAALPLPSSAGDRTTALAAVHTAVANLCALGAPGTRWTLHYHAVCAGIATVTAAIERAEAAGIDAPALRAALAPLRSICNESALFRRMQAWPRGIVGDAETIALLVEGRSTLPARSLAATIEAYALSSPIAQQHRNKLAWQGELVRRALADPAGGSRAPITPWVSPPPRERASSPAARRSTAERGRDGEPPVPVSMDGRSPSRDGAGTDQPARAAHVLVVACGSAQDLDGPLALAAPVDARVVLNDLDEAALAGAAARLSRYRAEIAIVPGNLLRRLPALARLGPFDLVLAGGLFDYLSDRQATLVLRGLLRLLRPGSGVFAFTNIAASNPFRAWIEWVLDWRLTERTEAELTDLAAAAGADPRSVGVARDSTGLALLATITAPSPAPGS